MDPIESLSTLASLDLRFPLRVNISFMLSREVTEEICRLNSIIVRDGFREIDFSKSSAPIPHITLLMGEVDEEEDLKGLIQALRGFSLHEPIKYKISQPYLRRPSRNFIFVDTVPQKAFRLLRRKLHEALSEFIDCELHGGPDNVSHITLGYAHRAYPGIDKLIKSAQSAGGLADTFQVAETGRRGTCKRLIARIPMSLRASRAESPER
jgi:2'-5' RNA ligase